MKHKAHVQVSGGTEGNLIDFQLDSWKMTSQQKMNGFLPNGSVPGCLSVCSVWKEFKTENCNTRNRILKAVFDVEEAQMDVSRGVDMSALVEDGELADMVKIADLSL
jgi:hypothetical protein